jgi:hypothetical protein
MYCMKPIWSTKLLTSNLCAIIIYGFSSPRYDVAVIQLFGTLKVDGSQR